MPLVRETGVVADPWQVVGDTDELPADGPVIISHARWETERERLIARPGPLGIRLKSDQHPALIVDDLDRFDLIALEFPKFTDGRAYSSARLLRERHRYQGELRAVGNVLRDQLQFMRRCGFNSYALPEGVDVPAWLKALHSISVAYQPAADATTPVLALRHRRNAPARDIAEEKATVKAGAEADARLSAAGPERDWSYDSSTICAGYWAY